MATIEQDDVDDVMDMLAHEEMPEMDAEEEMAMAFDPYDILRVVSDGAEENVFDDYAAKPPEKFPSAEAMRRLMHMR